VDSPRHTSFTDGNLQQFFGDMLLSATKNQSKDVSPHAISYVTDVLVVFHQTAKLFSQGEGRVPVLSEMLSEALESDHYRKISMLRQLGDTSLMVSGYFPEAVSRRCVDLDYYKKMGKVAYSQLDSLTQELNIFFELSDRFQCLSHIINEVSERTHDRAMNIHELLEYFMNTGSERIFEKLKGKGIIPLRSKKRKILF